MIVTLLFLIFFVFMAVGIPIGFSMAFAATSLILGVTTPLAIVFQKMVSGVDSFPLLALPLFVTAGILMHHGGISNKMFGVINCLVGHVRGGLAMVMSLCSCFFGFVTGSGVADTAAIGSIIMPEMVKRGYSKQFTATLQACTGILGGIIPPSIVLIVIGVSGQLSIGALYLGAIIPGFTFGFCLMITAYFISRKRKYRGFDAFPGWRKTLVAGRESLLPMLNPVIILGGIYTGVFTPTEAAAIAVLYALFLSLIVYKSIKPKQLFSILRDCIHISTAILIIMSAGVTFSWIMAANGAPELMREWVLNISQNKYVVMALVMFIGFVAGMVMEGLAIVIIFTPVFLPLIQSFGWNPIHFGVVWALNNAIGAITPPVGLALMTACKVIDTPYPPPFRDYCPFIMTMLVALAIVIMFPVLTLWLANLQ